VRQLIHPHRRATIVLKRQAMEHMMSIPSTGTTGKVYRSSGRVAERYGRCVRTLNRWLTAGFFPSPDIVVNGRRLWLDETLDRFDVQQRAAERETAA